MKIGTLMLLLFSSLLVSNAYGKDPVSILLTKENTLELRGEVNAFSVSKLQNDLLKIYNKGKTKEVYLVLDTPGGDMFAGLSLISFIRGLPGLKVHTISLFSASMGFILVEALDNRYATPDSVLMSHRAYGGSEGFIPGSFDSRLSASNYAVMSLYESTAKRMGLSLKDYMQKIREELWLIGQQSVDENAVDSLAYPHCGPDLSGTHTEDLMFFGLKISLEMSDCPLIRAPLSISFGGNDKKVDKEKEEKIRAWFYNREEYVIKYCR